MKVNKTKRRIWAGTLGMTLNALDSLSALGLAEMMRLNSEGLTTGEQIYVIKKREKIQEAIRDLRRLSHRIKKSC